MLPAAQGHDKGGECGLVQATEQPQYTVSERITIMMVTCGVMEIPGTSEVVRWGLEIRPTPTLDVVLAVTDHY
jgi:hypothetical protein